MRLFDIVTASPAALGQGVNTLTVNGPTYNFTSQSQILRFLMAHCELDFSASSDVNTPQLWVADAYFGIVLNPNRGADRIIRIPATVTLFGPYGQGISAFGGDAIGTFQTFNFNLKNCDIRGDDIPNYGGVQFVPGGQTDVFSVKTFFNFCIPVNVFNPGDTATIQPYFDVLADLSDYTEVQNRRQ